jgi:DNA polymerase-3 subunit gamma/tau
LRKACETLQIEAEDEALFWIARESTGSCRDAYTLFDQVVSFSDGHIRSSVIREKLGLVGLDTLNAFAEACAAADLKGALALVDELISSGVAVETFVVDLAGYYHSLLLLKAGVTREAALGFPPARFSAAVLAAYDAARLERAGELLYALHRDIRYSVSPRFELETLVSKLCWLEKWISPAQLAEAVGKAREVLAGARGIDGGARRPLAEGNFSESESGESPQTQTAPQQAVPQTAPDRQTFSSEAGSFSERFNRRIAERTNARSDSQENRPLENAPSAPAPQSIDPAVQKVLEVFEGTIVENR